MLYLNVFCQRKMIRTLRLIASMRQARRCCIGALSTEVSKLASEPAPNAVWQG